MKIFREYLFRIIFFTAIFFCYCGDAYSNYTAQSSNQIELISNSNSILNNFLNSDIEPFGDDQISHSHEFIAIMELDYRIPQLHFYSMVIKVSYSIWQPPKIS